MTLSIINPTTLIAKAISRGKTPKQASSLPVPLYFTGSVTQLQLSLNVITGSKNVHGVDGIQSVFIDNSNNATTCTVQFDSMLAPIVAPPYSQAIYPVFFSGELLNFTATSTGAVTVNLMFLNTREIAALWSTKIPIGGTVNVTGSDVFTQPYTGQFTDVSAALTTANTSQQLMAANGNRQIIAIRNPATAASQNIAAPEPVYLGFSTAAVVGGLGMWELLPGESLPNFLMTSTETINWIAATAGHQLTAKYM